MAFQRRGTTGTDLRSAGYFRAAVVAWLAAGLWAWSLLLLMSREHQILDYHVVASAPPLWGFIVLGPWSLASILLIGVALGSACLRQARVQRRIFTPSAGWLLAAGVIPLIDVFRALEWSIPATFPEALFLAWLSGAAIASLVASFQPPWKSREDLPNSAAPPREPAWRWATAGPHVLAWLLAIAAAVWWYVQGCRALDEYLLGYHDFGHFGFRVASTWSGRGFLFETPSLPAFWDHFNPALALLAPLWGLWPNPRLFILLQALCLAAPAPLIFRIARAWGTSATVAAVWAAVYLAFPPVSQLNLNYSYGWHPISLALPWMFAAASALLARRYGWAVAFSVLAASCEEAVIVALACLAAALGFQSWWLSRGACANAQPDREDTAERADAKLARCLPPWAWIATWATLTVAFVVIARYAGFTPYQTGRFENLGDSGLAIALSPLLRPSAFWGQALHPQSLLFLITLLLPLTPAVLIRGRWLLLAMVFPLGLLLGWNHPPAKSIAFQYVTTLLPILLLAGIAGARRGASEWRGSAGPCATPGPSARRDQALSRQAAGGPATVTGQAAGPTDLSLALAALASCLVASTLFGALPWSSPTLAIMLAQTYQTDETPTVVNPRGLGTPANRFLSQVVRQVNQKQTSVLASGRVAAHLLNVRRLESVEQAVVRWDALRLEAGDGRSPVEVFDWIVLDTCERFQQSLDKMEYVMAEARRVRYQEVAVQHGIFVFGRPGLKEAFPELGAFK